MSKADVPRNPRMRARGSTAGRTKALAALDRLVAGKTNRKAMRAALQAKFQEDPYRFFRKVVMPLLPRETTWTPDHDGVVVWQARPFEGPAGKKQEEVTP